MSRPPLPEEQRRTKHLVVRMTAEEKRRAWDVARAAKMTLSEFVRRALGLAR